MIKIIAFDLVGVLLGENDLYLDSEESKIERLLGSEKNDEELIKASIKATNLSESEVKKIINKIIFNLYDVKIDVRKIKDRYKGAKIFVASNHFSTIREFLNENYGDIFDEIIISAEINAYKPNKNFYEFLIKKANVKPEEILFLDDRKENVEAARKCGINSEQVIGYNVTKIIDKYIGDEYERNNI